MSAYKPFGVVGGGMVGLPIVTALAAKKRRFSHLALPPRLPSKSGSPWRPGYHSLSWAKPNSSVKVRSIPGFVAHVLTTSPASELEERVLRLEGERVTFSGVAARVIEEEKGSTGWDVFRNAEGMGDDKAGGNALWALWPGHRWLTAKEVHKL
ncbi:hypothetical protein R3P38DRAFT_3258752 [Favolaschia claudopus]|uniref:Uncharacterized protein n=1 Tax=Favolaschia claudopus TaxID=2862362 RepID=A0AAW0D1J8_9AGAR